MYFVLHVLDMFRVRLIICLLCINLPATSMFHVDCVPTKLCIVNKILACIAIYIPRFLDRKALPQ